jgi:hypothetical protein
MRQTFIALLLIISLFTAALASPASLQASGTTTTSSRSGQVVIRDENGVVYLTTTTVAGRATNSATTNLLGTPIQLPKGFAANIANVINSVMNLIMLVGALLVLLYMVWGAFDWLTSGGDKGKTESARNKITAAVIGLIILSASYAMTLLIVRFLGFRDLNDVFNNVQSIDGSRRVTLIGTPSPTPSVSPTPSATPTYSENLGELMRR